MGVGNGLFLHNVEEMLKITKNLNSKPKPGKKPKTASINKEDREIALKRFNERQAARERDTWSRGLLAPYMDGFEGDAQVFIDNNNVDNVIIKTHRIEVNFTNGFKLRIERKDGKNVEYKLITPEQS